VLSGLDISGVVSVSPSDLKTSPRLRNDQLYVEWDVKPYTLTHSHAYDANSVDGRYSALPSIERRSALTDPLDVVYAAAT